MNHLDYGGAKDAHLDRCESFYVGAFITVLGALSLDTDKRTKAPREGSDRSQFSRLVATTNDLEHDISQEATTYQMLINKILRDDFPNVEVLLRIYLTLISNCSGEKSLFKLQLINDELRSTTSQSRLVHLTMLSAEWNIMLRINLDFQCCQNVQTVQWFLRKFNRCTNHI